MFDNASQLTDRIENGVSITFGNDATHQVTSDNGFLASRLAGASRILDA